MTDWNLDQIERELQHSDPCEQCREVAGRTPLPGGWGENPCEGKCPARVTWLAQPLRLPGALIRHLLGVRTDEHGDLWDRAVGAVTRAEASKWRYGATDWRCDGLVLVERGVVLGLVERFRAPNKYITYDYRRTAERLLKELAGQTTPITARAPGESDADFIERLRRPKPMRKCTDDDDPVVAKGTNGWLDAAVAGFYEMSTAWRAEQTVQQNTHLPGSRAAIEAAVNSVEGAKFVGIEECFTSRSVRIFVKGPAAEMTVEAVGAVMPVGMNWSIWPV